MNENERKKNEKILSDLKVFIEHYKNAPQQTGSDQQKSINIPHEQSLINFISNSVEINTLRSLFLDLFGIYESRNVNHPKIENLFLVLSTLVKRLMLLSNGKSDKQSEIKSFLQILRESYTAEEKKVFKSFEGILLQLSPILNSISNEEINFETGPAIGLDISFTSEQENYFYETIKGSTNSDFLDDLSLLLKRIANHPISATLPVVSESTIEYIQKLSDLVDAQKKKVNLVQTRKSHLDLVLGEFRRNNK